MAIAQRLLPFGVKRLLYSGRTAKSYAAEVNGEFGKKNKKIILHAKHLHGVMQEWLMKIYSFFKALKKAFFFFTPMFDYPVSLFLSV